MAAIHSCRSAPKPLFLPQHLGDFPHQLSQHCHAVYEYTPPPPMSWPELADEIWCHRYYLANLCDEDRFRNWPVVEHIPLLQVRRLAGIACTAAVTVCWHVRWRWCMLERGHVVLLTRTTLAWIFSKRTTPAHKCLACSAALPATGPDGAVAC